MNARSRMRKIVAKVETRSGKAFYMRVGTCFDNDDGTSALYIDAWPVSGGKLYIRDLDPEGDRRTAPGEGEPLPLPGNGASAADDLPF